MKGAEHLLAFIEANGGRIHRGALNESIMELHKNGLIKEEFTPGQPGLYVSHNYDWVLTPIGELYADTGGVAE